MNDSSKQESQQDGFDQTVMKAVYCYYFPESSEVMNKYSVLPNSLFRVTAKVEDAQRDLDELIQPSLPLPATPEDCVNIDCVHEPIIDRIVQAYKQSIPGLNTFHYRYPTSGSSEGIFHILSHLKMKGVKEINVLRGEYEGYGIQAENLGLRVRVHDEELLFDRDARLEYCLRHDPGYWFISQPSARDGNIMPHAVIDALCDANHKVIMDYAYVGATKEHVFPAIDENIYGAVMSFSKPYGVFRQRAGGFAFMREAIPTLFGNKWFKDIGRLFQALALAEEIGPGGLYEQYRPVQEKAVAQLNESYGLNMKPSDTLLLAHIHKEDAEQLSGEQKKLIGPYARGEHYRFCLTPFFEAYE